MKFIDSLTLWHSSVGERDSRQTPTHGSVARGGETPGWRDGLAAVDRERADAVCLLHPPDREVAIGVAPDEVGVAVLVKVVDASDGGIDFGQM